MVQVILSIDGYIYSSGVAKCSSELSAGRSAVAGLKEAGRRGGGR